MSDPKDKSKAPGSQFLPADAGALASPATGEDELRAEISRRFELMTRKLHDRGVKYRNGDKYPDKPDAKGVLHIDCSGFIHEAALDATAGLTNLDFVLARGKSQRDQLDSPVPDQLDFIRRHSAGHFFLQGKENVKLKDLKEGMIIGVDHGDMNRPGDRQPGWDTGLDHIVLIYRDTDPDSKTRGELMVGQSSHSTQGVAGVPLAEWFKKVPGLVDIQVVDLVKMAEAAKAAPDPVKIAARDAADKKDAETRRQDVAAAAPPQTIFGAFTLPEVLGIADTRAAPPAAKAAPVPARR